MSNPFPELAPYDTAIDNPRPVQPRTIEQADSFLADEMRKERDAQVRQAIEASPNPDQVARGTRVAREAGVPPLMVDNRLDEAERGLNAQKLTGMMERYPAIGKWAATNPRGAATAQDDHQSLGILGSAWDTLSKVPDELRTALELTGKMGWEHVATVNEIGDTLRYPIEAGIATVGNMTKAFNYDPDVVDQRLGRAEQGLIAGVQSRVDRARPTYTGPIQQGLLQGIDTLPLTAMALLTRDPVQAASLIGTVQGTSSYQDARRAGKTMPDAVRYGMTQGIIEGATELAPESAMLDALAKRLPIGKTFARFLAAELPGEATATFLQSLSTWQTMAPEKSYREWAAGLPAEEAQTVLGVLSGSAFQVAAARTGQYAGDVAGHVVNRVSEARQARQQAQVIDQIGKAAQESKLNTRDPVAYGELQRAIAQDHGIENVAISGEALQAYMQSDAYDHNADVFGDYSGQIEEAAATGGDVMLPVDFAFGALPKTEAWSAVKDDIRLTAGGMSAREAATFEEAMADHLGELSARMEAQDKALATERTAREKLTDDIATKLGESYTAPAARVMAEVTAQYLQTRAARQGIELTGNEFANVDVRQIIPEALAQAKSADATDLVINAMRKGKGAMNQGGKSLIQFLADRGGLNDTGGDLAALGLGDWHKGKVGQRKAIRPFDPQASLAGISGAGDFGLDSALRAAIDAGYFPELQGMEQLHDEVAPMIEAITAELAGNPRFAQQAKVDPMRAAADELRQMLSEAGHDVDAMSDADVRSFIDKLAQQAPGDALEQSGEPVVTLTGEEIAPKGSSTKELRDAARKWFDEHLKGTSVQSQALGADVQFIGSRKAISASADPRKLKLFAALPDLVAKADEVDVRPDYSGDSRTKAWHYLRGTVNLEGKPVSVTLSVREHVNGNLYYNHVIEEGAAPELVDPARKAGEGTGGSAQGQSVHETGDGINLALAPLGQRGDAGVRARVQFDQGRVLIELFQNRNLSSYFHEFGHMALENLRADAEVEGAPEQIKADWQAVQDWFAANGHPVTDGISANAHELWARGVERYLMEGKTPSPALKRIFDTVRAWMVGIYKTLDRLRSPITPEIREIMDRLIATDDEIAAARERQDLAALFKDAASIGMSDAEFAAYQSQVDTARAQANAALVDKTLAALRARETKRWREARAPLREEIAADVDARPIYRALRNLKTLPISSEWIRDEMGEDALGLLPRRVPPIHRDTGVNPTAIAEMSGFATGREMIDALIGAEMVQRHAREGGDQRSMREREIETATDAEMNRRFGDPLNDGSIEREALAAVHNDMQGEVIASEIRVLGRRTGRPTTPYALAREWARGKVRSGRVVDEASGAAVQRYARAAAKAGRAAEQAMLAQDIDETFRQKQFQMLNNALVSEAKAALDEVDGAVKRMERIASRKTMASVDQDYLEQAQALLEEVELRPRSQIGIDRQGKWAEWAAAREAEGYDVVVPPSFEASIGKTHFTRLSTENLLALDETVKQIVHLGRLKQTLLDNKDRRDFDEVVKEAENGAGNIKGKPPHDLMEPGRWDALKAGVNAIDAALLKMETVFDWLDGGDSNGVFNRIAFRPVAEAQVREQDMTADYYGQIKTLFGAVPARTLQRWTDAVTLPFTDRETGKPVRLRRQQLIAVALNTGNEGNLQRLTDGYGWNAGALQAYLASELTADEWQFVQGVWDTIETLWPQIEAMERRINGIAPEKVAPTPIVTPHGTFGGGYYPAVYDITRDLVAEEHRGKAADLFDAAYTRASTRSSASKARSEKVARPILLDLGVINRHLGEVIHDITHREAVMQAHRFLTDRRVMAAVDKALGPEIRKQFRPWVKFVANSWAMERAGNEGIGKFFNKLRANATAVGMGFRVTTALTQVAGYSNSIEVVGEKWMAEAIARASASPIESWNFVRERSGEVRHRMDTLDRDIRLAISQGAGNVDLGAVKRFMYHGIGYMDRVVVVPTWIAAYNKALSQGMSEEDAGYAGDKAVRASQGAGSPKDLAAISRGTGQYGKMLQLFTMFYSYFSATYQRERTLGRDVMGADRRRPRSLPKLMARAWWLLVVPPLLTELLKAGLTGNGGPDDDEWWLQWTARKMLANALGPIPFVRDVFEPTWNAAVGNKVFGYSMSPLQRIGDSAVAVGSDIHKVASGDETMHATKDVLETAGYATGLVPGQIASAAQFLVDVGMGDADPQDFSDWVEGLTTGKIKS